MTAIHYGKKNHIRTEHAAYSDNTYEQVPFSCEPGLKDEEIRHRISAAIYKRFKPSHHAGCGYSCNVKEFVRESPIGGYVVLMHYQGIGD